MIRYRLFLPIAARLIALTVLSAMAFSAVAQNRPAKRIALVIGNDAYQKVGKLEKAGNDATVMARELRAAGFEVQSHRNLDYRGMVKAVETLSTSITGGDEVVVFFAGHGVQIRDGNFLLPVDIEANSESEVARTAYGLNDLLDKLAEAKPVFSLVIVDACRDNPLRTRGRSIGGARGLNPPEPAKGQMIVYSAGRGQQALDSLSRSDKDPNGVFTREFVARMKRPGVRIEELVREVQDAVESLARTVSHSQRPALYSEARGNFYFFAPTTLQGAPQVAPVPAVTAAQREDKFWDDAKAAGNREGFQAYLESYPKGRYASLARANVARLSVAGAFVGGLSGPSVQTQTKNSPSDAVNTPSPQTSIPSNFTPGTTFKDCDDCPEMVTVPSGSFVMGSPESEVGRFPSESPQRTVKIDNDFAVGRYEVTRAQYAKFMTESGHIPKAGNCLYMNLAAPRPFLTHFFGGKMDLWVSDDVGKDWRNPGFGQGDDHPVVCVSSEDASAYVVWLSRQTSSKYRLLTEAEWEYAARAGSITMLPSGDNLHEVCKHGNVGDRSLVRETVLPTGARWTGLHSCDDGFGYTAPVGKFTPNKFGLYDMIGNASEWTADCWNETYNAAPIDGGAWTTGDCTRRVYRGAAWLNSNSHGPPNARSANRKHDSNAHRSSAIGFRIAKTL